MLPLHQLKALQAKFQRHITKPADVDALTGIIVQLAQPQLGCDRAKTYVNFISETEFYSKIQAIRDELRKQLDDACGQNQTPDSDKQNFSMKYDISLQL
ncbi:MAG: hypothetical protein V7K25_28215 [Nostoc sp.]|uniref:hypothetical protein n=1 Tax=Nostoc sp. TaxID=1180 RepID=UPI002FF49BD8